MESGKPGHGIWSDSESRSTGPQISSNFLQHLSLNELEALFPDAVAEAQLFTVVRDLGSGCLLLSQLRSTAKYYCFRTHRELNELSLAEYIDLARWLPHPHLRPQLDVLRLQMARALIRGCASFIRRSSMPWNSG